MRVLRWEVPVSVRNPVTVVVIDPGAPVVLVASREHEVVEFWTVESEAGVRMSRGFTIYATGEPIPDTATHRGSCLDADGLHVWHLFEVS